jgi:hypothetical protein
MKALNGIKDIYKRLPKMIDDRELRIKEIEQILTELRSSLPAHSIKPEMLIRIEELEDELERLKADKE